MKRYLRSLATAAGALAVMAMFSACNSFPKAPRMGPDDFPNARVPLSRAPASNAGVDLPVSPDVEFLQVDSPEMNKAMEQFVESGSTDQGAAQQVFVAPLQALGNGAREGQGCLQGEKITAQLRRFVLQQSAQLAVFGLGQMAGARELQRQSRQRGPVEQACG